MYKDKTIKFKKYFFKNCDINNTPKIFKGAAFTGPPHDSTKQVNDSNNLNRYLTIYNYRLNNQILKVGLKKWKKNSVINIVNYPTASTISITKIINKTYKKNKNFIFKLIKQNKIFLNILQEKTTKTIQEFHLLFFSSIKQFIKTEKRLKKQRGKKEYIRIPLILGKTKSQFFFTIKQFFDPNTKLFDSKKINSLSEKFIYFYFYAIILKQDKFLKNYGKSKISYNISTFYKRNFRTTNNLKHKNYLKNSFLNKMKNKTNSKFIIQNKHKLLKIIKKINKRLITNLQKYENIKIKSYDWSKILLFKFLKRYTYKIYQKNKYLIITNIQDKLIIIFKQIINQLEQKFNTSINLLFTLPFINKNISMKDIFLTLTEFFFNSIWSISLTIVTMICSYAFIFLKEEELGKFFSMVVHKLNQKLLILNASIEEKLSHLNRLNFALKIINYKRKIEKSKNKSLTLISNKNKNLISIITNILKTPSIVVIFSILMYVMYTTGCSFIEAWVWVCDVGYWFLYVVLYTMYWFSLELSKYYNVTLVRIQENKEQLINDFIENAKNVTTKLWKYDYLADLKLIYNAIKNIKLETIYQNINKFYTTKLQEYKTQKTLTEARINTIKFYNKDKINKSLIDFFNTYYKKNIDNLTSFNKVTLYDCHTGENKIEVPSIFDEEKQVDFLKKQTKEVDLYYSNWEEHIIRYLKFRKERTEYGGICEIYVARRYTDWIMKMSSDCIENYPDTTLKLKTHEKERFFAMRSQLTHAESTTLYNKLDVLCRKLIRRLHGLGRDTNFYFDALPLNSQETAYVRADIINLIQWLPFKSWRNKLYVLNYNKELLIKEGIIEELKVKPSYNIPIFNVFIEQMHMLKQFDGTFILNRTYTDSESIMLKLNVPSEHDYIFHENNPEKKNLTLPTPNYDRIKWLQQEDQILDELYSEKPVENKIKHLPTEIPDFYLGEACIQYYYGKEFKDPNFSRALEKWEDLLKTFFDKVDDLDKQENFFQELEDTILSKIKTAINLQEVVLTKFSTKGFNPFTPLNPIDWYEKSLNTPYFGVKNSSNIVLPTLIPSQNKDNPQKLAYNRNNDWFSDYLSKMLDIEILNTFNKKTKDKEMTFFIPELTHLANNEQIYNNWFKHRSQIIRLWDINPLLFLENVHAILERVHNNFINENSWLTNNDNDNIAYEYIFKWIKQIFFNDDLNNIKKFIHNNNMPDILSYVQKKNLDPTIHMLYEKLKNFIEIVLMHPFPDTPEIQQKLFEVNDLYQKIFYLPVFEHNLKVIIIPIIIYKIFIPSIFISTLIFAFVIKKPLNYLALHFNTDAKKFLWKLWRKVRDFFIKNLNRLYKFMKKKIYQLIVLTLIKLFKLFQEYTLSFVKGILFIVGFILTKNIRAGSKENLKEYFTEVKSRAINAMIYKTERLRKAYEKMKIEHPWYVKYGFRLKNPILAAREKIIKTPPVWEVTEAMKKFARENFFFDLFYKRYGIDKVIFKANEQMRISQLQFWYLVVGKDLSIFLRKLFLCFKNINPKRYLTDVKMTRERLFPRLKNYKSFNIFNTNLRAKYMMSKRDNPRTTIDRYKEALIAVTRYYPNKLLFRTEEEENAVNVATIEDLKHYNKKYKRNVKLPSNVNWSKSIHADIVVGFDNIVIPLAEGGTISPIMGVEQQASNVNNKIANLKKEQFNPFPIKQELQDVRDELTGSAIHLYIAGDLVDRKFEKHFNRVFGWISKAKKEARLDTAPENLDNVGIQLVFFIIFLKQNLFNNFKHMTLKDLIIGSKKLKYSLYVILTYTYEKRIIDALKIKIEDLVIEVSTYKNKWVTKYLSDLENQKKIRDVADDFVLKKQNELNITRAKVNQLLVNPNLNILFSQSRIEVMEFLPIYKKYCKLRIAIGYASELSKHANFFFTSCAEFEKRILKEINFHSIIMHWFTENLAQELRNSFDRRNSSGVGYHHLPKSRQESEFDEITPKRYYETWGYLKFWKLQHILEEPYIPDFIYCFLCDKPVSLWRHTISLFYEGEMKHNSRYSVEKQVWKKLEWSTLLIEGYVEVLAVWRNIHGNTNNGNTSPYTLYWGEHIQHRNTVKNERWLTDFLTNYNKLHLALFNKPLMLCDISRIFFRPFTRTKILLTWLRDITGISKYWKKFKNTCRLEYRWNKLEKNYFEKQLFENLLPNITWYNILNTLVAVHIILISVTFCIWAAARVGTSLKPTAWFFFISYSIACISTYCFGWLNPRPWPWQARLLMWYIAAKATVFMLSISHPHSLMLTLEDLYNVYKDVPYLLKERIFDYYRDFWNISHIYDISELLQQSKIHCFHYSTIEEKEKLLILTTDTSLALLDVPNELPEVGTKLSRIIYATVGIPFMTALDLFIEHQDEYSWMWDLAIQPETFWIGECLQDPQWAKNVEVRNTLKYLVKSPSQVPTWFEYWIGVDAGDCEYFLRTLVKEDLSIKNVIYYGMMAAEFYYGCDQGTIWDMEEDLLDLHEFLWSLVGL